MKHIKLGTPGKLYVDEPIQVKFLEFMNHTMINYIPTSYLKNTDYEMSLSGSLITVKHNDKVYLVPLSNVKALELV